jgi:hypothetical protein
MSQFVAFLKTTDRYDAGGCIVATIIMVLLYGAILLS